MRAPVLALLAVAAAQGAKRCEPHCKNAHCRELGFPQDECATCDATHACHALADDFDAAKAAKSPKVASGPGVDKVDRLESKRCEKYCKYAFCIELGHPTKECAQCDKTNKCNPDATDFYADSPHRSNQKIMKVEGSAAASFDIT